jgi:predicted dehydrogenase
VSLFRSRRSKEYVMPHTDRAVPAVPGPSATSRRRFLQGSALAGAGILSGPLILAAESANPAASTTANSKLNVALVGAGGQGRGDMKALLNTHQRIVAICDLDEKQIALARDKGDNAVGAKPYSDYRRLLDDADSFDAVIIGTPDHWHAPLCKAFIKAGKHVYCEKPLTRTLHEARELRELVRANPKVVTQLGNQGSADATLRRSVELIRAGALGQVREVHAWLGNNGPGANRPDGEDEVPRGFHWDFWCGPSPYRPYKGGYYHPINWRNWFDFGGGPLADFTCHIFNTALRALDLTYATRIEVVGESLGKESYARSAQLQMHFPARRQLDAERELDPVTVQWYDGGRRPDDELLKDVLAVEPKKPEHGCLLVGEKGILWTNPWNNAAQIKLHDDEKLQDVTHHEPTKQIAVTLPRNVGHMQEWVNAIKGQGKAWSDFDFGGHLTEIGLAGVLAIRLGHEIQWDGAALKADDPKAEQIITPQYRRAWIG